MSVSVDSVFSHANFGKTVGGISYPMLADFHPKGEMADKYGLYIAKAGITDRATVIIDADGIVQYAESVTPGGQRDIAELAAKVEEIAGNYGKPLPAAASETGLAADAKLYVKNNCGSSRAALLARDNLHLEGALPVVNVSDNPGALDDLKAKSGKTQAPCLVAGDEALLESKEIVAKLAAAVRPL